MIGGNCWCDDVWVVCVLLLCVVVVIYLLCVCIFIAGIRGEVAAVMIVAVFEPMGFTV